jgi:hypothetical protein
VTERLRGFMISPALWMVAGLALLMLVVLSAFGRRKPRRRPIHA